VLLRFRSADQVDAVKGDVAQTATERNKIAEVHFTIGTADEYVSVDV